MRVIFFLTALSCCISLSLGLYALFRRMKQNRLRWSLLDIVFAVLCFLITAGTFTSAFFVSASSESEAFAWYRAFAIPWELIPGFFLIFASLLSGQRPNPLMPLVFLPSAVTLTVHVVRPRLLLAAVTRIPCGWHLQYAEKDPWYWIHALNYSLCTGIAIIVLARATATAKESLIRRRARIVLTFIIPMLVMFFATLFLTRALSIHRLPPLMPVFIPLLEAGLALALFRYNLLELTPQAVAQRVLTGVYDAVVLTDPKGVIIDTNLASPLYPGLQPNFARGLPLSELIPEARDGARWLASRTAGNEVFFETEFAFTPNRNVPAAVRVRAIGGRKKMDWGFIISAHDLSVEKDLSVEMERRIATSSVSRSVEARFARAFRASPAGMAIVDLDTHIFLDINEAAARIFGKKVEEIIGTKFEALNLRISGEDLDSGIRRLLRGESMPPRENAIARPDASRALCLVAASPLEFGGKKAALFSLVDVTELDKLRNEVVKAQKLESIGVLAGGIAHDFNNILTAVMGNVSLALMSVGESGDAAECLRRADAACVRARELSRQLLTFAKGGEPSPEPADILLLAREAVRMATAGSTVVATFSAESGLPAAYVDSGQMLQVFNNIALNAVQAMSGGGTLAVRARHFSFSGMELDAAPSDLAKGEYIAVEFEDEGKGIAPELIERIFDPYVTTKRNGSGLGLAICYSILKRHKGSIGVASKPGEGTIFTVYVPVSEEEPSEKSHHQLHLGKGNVLLMDDELAVRSTAEHMLRRLGYEPTLCPDGESAVEAFKESRRNGFLFSAVILDLTVPAGMGGVDAAGIIRSIDPTVPIYVSSGYADAPVLADYAAYGFDGVIAKPYGMEELGHRLAGE